MGGHVRLYPDGVTYALVTAAGDHRILLVAGIGTLDL